MFDIFRAYTVNLFVCFLRNNNNNNNNNNIIIIIIIKALFNERTHLTMSIFHEALKYNMHALTRQIDLKLSTGKPILVAFKEALP